MRLIQAPGRITNGSILFAPNEGESFDIVALGKKDPRLLDLRGGHISMVFQEPDDGAFARFTTSVDRWRKRFFAIAT